MASSIAIQGEDAWGAIDPVGQSGGDASRYLVGQQVEVDLEPQRWPRSRTDVRKVGTDQ